jgi:hypothetical protein
VAPACETPPKPAGSSGEDSAASQASDMPTAHETLSTPAGSSSSSPAEPTGSQCAPLPSAAVAGPAVPQSNAAQPPEIDTGPDDLEQLMRLLGVGTSSSGGSSDGWGEEDSVRPAAGPEAPEPPATPSAAPLPHSCPTAWSAT